MTGCNCQRHAGDAAKGLADLLEQQLLGRYGPVISNDSLRLVLGYSSMEAFRQALSRQTVHVPVFSLANRRGKYALATDVAKWLAEQRNAVAANSDDPSQ
ncbi:MAG: hypothetical protein E6R07_07400 [Nevskiaceae bacterium]|nr:MAG: hypothetical protein E6R07_07400 [Nevskiaceae bacterium]